MGKPIRILRLILDNPRNNMVKINPTKKLKEKINTSDLFIILIDNF